MRRDEDKVHWILTFQLELSSEVEAAESHALLLKPRAASTFKVS